MALEYNPTIIVAKLIQTAIPALVAGEGSGSGWRLFRDFEPDTGADIPDTIVTIYNAPGGAPMPKWLLDFPSVQIRVRATPTGRDAAYDLLKNIRSFILSTDSYTYNSDVLRSVTCQGDIMSLGLDGKNRQRYVQTFNLITQPAHTSYDKRQPIV